jgi:hypothetical protein
MGPILIFISCNYYKQVGYSLFFKWRSLAVACLLDAVTEQVNIEDSLHVYCGGNRFESRPCSQCSKIYIDFPQSLQANTMAICFDIHISYK